MIKRYDLSSLLWTLTGVTPYHWMLVGADKILNDAGVEIPTIPARVPGSVQQALLEAGLLPDWNVGLNGRGCEWAENRHWIFQTRLPGEWFEGGQVFRLVCHGLDDRGWVYVDGKEAGRFENIARPTHFRPDAVRRPA